MRISAVGFRGLFVPLSVFFMSLSGGRCAQAHAGDPARWTVDDILLAESAGQWALSQDGRSAVWVKSTVEEVEKEEKKVSNLWRTNLDSGDSWQLTRGFDSASRPEFSPDGRHVAFLFDRQIPGADQDEFGRLQLWALALAGGEAFPVTRLERSVEHFGWLDGDGLLVAAREAPSWWERERKEKKDTAEVVDDAEHEPPVRLFRVSLADGTIERLTHNHDWIDQLAVSPDGRLAVFSSQQSLSYEFDQKEPPKTFLIEIESGEIRPLLEDGTLLPSSFEWSPDSRGFFLSNPYTRHPVYREATINELWYCDADSLEVEKVDLDWDWGVWGGYAATPDGVVALLADGVRYRPARVDRSEDGWRRRDLGGNHVGNIESLAISPDGSRLVYQLSRATLPPQWYGASLGGARIEGERRLTHLNPGYEGKDTGQVEVIRWRGALGEEVEGLLHYPLGWRAGRKYPLILDIHGGPTGVDRDRWDQSWSGPNILWRQRGAFVLQVNYHGSGGYGLDWVESIGEGKYYDLEVPDLEAGVDHLLARGLVEPQRLASSGWSNGGILTAALITESRRYRAAIVGAADVEWFSDWANVDFGAAFDNYYLGGPPWEIPDVYLAKSPFFRLHEVTTPTLVHTGTEDRNVPPHQSWSLFRVLQQVGKAPAKLVLYPGEPHGLRRIAHQRRKLEEDLAWFDRYLFAAEEKDNPALKKDSLLAGLLARSRAARVDRRFGVDSDGALIPETVRFQGVRIGRFEVTRAQYAAFDPKMAVTPGRENHPATGVTLEQAQAYVDWLAMRTGWGVRLPTHHEAERLAKAAGTRGNTLDLWAGYRTNPDDRRRLVESLEQLGEAPLLLAVGSRPGAGEPVVFDLDGNAAEWAVDEKGRGVAVGPSADRGTDEAAEDEPTPAYTGFRIVIAGEKDPA